MMLYYTNAFCLGYGVGRVCKNREYIFDIQNKKENLSCY